MDCEESFYCIFTRHNRGCFEGIFSSLITDSYIDKQKAIRAAERLANEYPKTIFYVAKVLESYCCEAMVRNSFS